MGSSATIAPTLDGTPSIKVKGKSKKAKGKRQKAKEKDL